MASTSAKMFRLIFVFGSNLSGHHGKGAALFAKTHYGAIQHRGIGFQGDSYAIPTKGKRTTDGKYPILPLSEIAVSVKRFLEDARTHQELPFVVTRIGCGLAGFTDDQMAPLFAGAPDNCEFDPAWAQFGLKPWTVATLTNAKFLNPYLKEH